MVKKRSVFDIDFDPDAEAESEGSPAGNQRATEVKSWNVQSHPLQNTMPVPPRRGPMASAITESVEANASRTAAEASIRAENDELAHEHVRLKKLGLITDLIPTADVEVAKLTRDRSGNADPELEELKQSILAVGLSNPIRVERTEGGFELIQGFRRLAAFRALAEETGDPRYTRIPAALVPRGEPLVDLYRKMVDENLVRKDVSFGEMAQLAANYARDTDMDTGEAVSDLFASALKQKRSYIRQFARLLDLTEGAIRYPEAIPRAMGLELAKALDAQSERAGDLIAALAATPNRDAEEEAAILRRFATAKPRAKGSAKSSARTTLRLGRPEGEARVTATDGRIELRVRRDFSSLSKVRLQAGIEALLRELDTE